MPVPPGSREMMLDDRVRQLRREGVTTNVEAEALAARAPRPGDPGDGRGSSPPAADAGRQDVLDETAGGGDLVVPDTPALVDVETGEALAPTVENAARVLDAVSRMRDRLSAVREQAVDVVRAASREQGVKTFHVGELDVVLSGGPGIDYDPETLASCLRDAGCPEERIDAVVKAEITYKIDRSVLKQLTGANEDYKAAAELAERPVEKRWSASTKPRRR